MPPRALGTAFSVVCFVQALAVTASAQERFDRTNRPVATHRFWGAKNWFPADATPGGGTYRMFPEPLVVQTTSHGLSIGYGSRIITEPAYFAREVEMDLTIGAERLNARSIPITAHTDRTVDLSFGPIMTRIGRGMPFVYVETDGTAPTITFHSAPKIFAQNKNILGVTVGGNNYGMFCPSGGQWTISDKVFICRAPAGRRYLSVAILPRASDLAEYTQAAFSFPTDTNTSWSYDPQTGSVDTTFNVTTQAKEGTSPNFIQVLYPHQYGRLKTGERVSDASYLSARGELKTFGGRSFTTVNTFHGLLPFLPLASASRGSAEELGLIRQVATESESFPSGHVRRRQTPQQTGPTARNRRYERG
jgi:endoglucanase Acf2